VAVPFLLDGYNLMHAVGAVPVGRGGFDTARRRFLDWLAGCPAVRGQAVRVVFDAQNSARDLGTSTHRGLLVTYSFRQTADDLIEALVSTEPNPQGLRVVSNDGRVREFARRHRCPVMTCGEFVDWLQRPETNPANPDREGGDEKEPSTPDELEMLMKAFGGKKW
jgi:hypothetical protein